MMTKKEYAKEIAAIIENAKVTESDKANGITLTGIVVDYGDGSPSPVIYIDSLYENGVGIEEAVDQVIEIADKHRNSLKVDTSILSSYKSVKSFLKARLYHQSTKAEVFSSAREFGFDDLIIIPVIQFSLNASCKVTKGMIENWGVDEAEVINAALNNVKKDREIMSLDSALSDLIGVGSTEEDFVEIDKILSPIIVTNRNRWFGAISILFSQEILKKIFPEGYRILPSSLHEVIVVGINAGTESELSGLVQCVNENEVDLTDQLSNHVYTFEF